EIHLGKSASARIGALAGAVLHHYSIRDPSATDLTGSRVDFLVSLPLTVRFKPWKNLVLDLRGGPGMSSRGRTHLLAGQRIYTRSAFRLEVGGGVGWSF